MSRKNANDYPSVKIANMVQRHLWPVADKVRMVKEASQPGMNVLYVARKYCIAPNLLFRWSKLMSDGGKVAVQVTTKL
jgi:transposase